MLNELNHIEAAEPGECSSDALFCVWTQITEDERAAYLVAMRSGSRAQVAQWCEDVRAAPRV